MKKLLMIIALAALTSGVFAQGYIPGDRAMSFRLENIDGNMVSPDDYPDAKGFIVIFTCNHCPYSVAYEDRIIELDKKYAPLGYPVIAINPNDPEIQPEDSKEKMKVRAREKGFTFPYLFDEGQKVYPVYGATRTPHVFLLNREKEELIVRYIGAIDNNYSDPDAVTERYVENAIGMLMRGRTPEPSITKAIGCSIKKKKS